MYLLPLVLVIALDHQMIEQHRQVKAELWNQIMGPESIEWEKLRACRKLGQADRKLVAAEHALWYGSIEEFWRLQRSFELSFTAASIHYRQWTGELSNPLQPRRNPDTLITTDAQPNLAATSLWSSLVTGIIVYITTKRRSKWEPYSYVSQSRPPRPSSIQRARSLAVVIRQSVTTR